MLSLDKYKDVTTTRGYKYHYYYALAQGTKPTLLFTHGFPSSSQDWHRVVPHFEQQGYGIIVPDTLGYGGTDKPTDPIAYKATSLAKDIVEIIDAEKLGKVIAVGHDWYVTPISIQDHILTLNMFLFCLFQGLSHHCSPRECSTRAYHRIRFPRLGLHFPRPCLRL